VENSTNKKLTKFPEYLSQVVDTRRFEPSQRSILLDEQVASLCVS
jgi:hypothetical protein